MNKTNHQLDLFQSQTLNPTYEIKRQIRLLIAKSNMSRDEIVVRMNKIAVREGMRSTITKATIDSWTKDSDPGRLPSPAWLTIFCYVMGSLGPISVMASPLGCAVIDNEDQKLLAWAKAELEKKRASKRARLALESIKEL